MRPSVRNNAYNLGEEDSNDMGFDDTTPFDATITFLGGMFPQDDSDWVYRNSKGNVHNAANVMQWNLIRGLASHLGGKLRVISSPFLGAFPKYFKKPIVGDFQFDIGTDVIARGVGFLNLPVIKHFSRYIRLRKPLRDAIDESTPPHAVIAYSFTSAMAYSLKRAKLADPSTITCLVVADLPGYMNLSTQRSMLRKIFGKYTVKRLYGTLKYVDCAVVLTEPMVPKMGFDKPYVVIDGISQQLGPRSADDKQTEATDSAEKTILYTGGLNEAFGVLNLVEAFRMLRDEAYRLVLCGAGDAVATIQEHAQADPRITYRGLVPHDEIVALQRQATVLVNPRQNVGEYVKYSFPSKIMEYMISGTPTVAYDLAGMPDDYQDYLYLVPENSVEALTATLERVLALSPAELQSFGQHAQEFVVQHKNPSVQTEKILRLITTVTQQREASYGRV